MPAVSITGCTEYKPSTVYESTVAVLAPLGGLGAFVKPGQTVLLKPNLLSPSAPDEAVVTHPYLVGAVARLVKDCGARAIIADSPGGPFSRFLLGRTYRKAGLESVAQDTGSSLNFNTEVIERSNPDGRLIKRFELIKATAEADVIINLPKLKTHAFMRLTGAAKNVFGLVPGVVKAGYHAKLVTPDRFAGMLLDLTLLVKPSLTVMDAVVGMEGDGPAAGSPKYIGLLLASPDCISLDAAMAAITSFRRDEIPILLAAFERGIEGADISQVEILGKPLESVRMKSFKPPRTGDPLAFSRMPAPVRHFISNSLIVPTEVRKADCTGCGDCHRMCPVDAITMKDKKATIDKGMCIRCYCCHEICPTKCIDLKPNLLSRLLMRR